MPAVLTTASALQCVHGAKLITKPSQQQLTVDGNPVLVQADLMSATIAGCPNTNAVAGETPCVAVTLISAGLAVNLSVGGQPVVLATAAGLTNATPPAPVMWYVVNAGQTKLEAS